jgi:hypothetical protein
MVQRDFNAIRFEGENQMTTLSEADEKMLREQDRIEKLKGPKGHGSYVPLPPTAEEVAWREAQAKRQEAAKRATPSPPRAEPDFLEEQRRQLIQQQHNERLKGPIKRQGG